MRRPPALPRRAALFIALSPRGRLPRSRQQDLRRRRRKRRWRRRKVQEAGQRRRRGGRRRRGRGGRSRRPRVRRSTRELRTEEPGDDQIGGGASAESQPDADDASGAADVVGGEAEAADGKLEE